MDKKDIIFTKARRVGTNAVQGLLDQIMAENNISQEAFDTLKPELTPDELGKLVAESSSMSTTAEFQLYTGNAGMKEFQKAMEDHMLQWQKDLVKEMMSFPEKKEAARKVVEEVFPNIDMDEVI
ncbi:MAG: hypothetical protein JSW41_03390 [Candidatus Aenigmatarchaeota archaeon]|nr:MAG: hypothetical protein JSW41_03390 [Candidatus Aenigmarchaeota archaeon]